MRKLRMHELNRLTNEEFKVAKKHPIVIVLDNVRSTLNVGSVFRTSDAFLCEKVYLCGLTPTPDNREMRKTALGGTETVAWDRYENTETAIQELQNNGYTIISIEQVSNSASLEDFDFVPHEKLAFVFGNEVKGVDQNVINISDHIIEIPQFGTKHSLNISVSAGIILWTALQNKVLKQ